MLNDGTEGVLNFVLYPVIFGKENLIEMIDFLMEKRVFPDIEHGKLQKDKLLSALNDAISKTGWKNECVASIGNHSEESVKALLREILRRIENA